MFKKRDLEQKKGNQSVLQNNINYLIDEIGRLEEKNNYSHKNKITMFTDRFIALPVREYITQDGSRVAIDKYASILPDGIESYKPQTFGSDKQEGTLIKMKSGDPLLCIMGISEFEDMLNIYVV